MSFWHVMNWIAWFLCAVFVLLLAVDFIKVEKESKGN